MLCRRAERRRRRPRSRPHADNVVVLAGQQDEAHQVAEGIDEGDDLGRQTAARAANGLVPGPPFAPLAFGWAVTMVPSTRAYSKSGSSDRFCVITHPLAS